MRLIGRRHLWDAISHFCTAEAAVWNINMLQSRAQEWYGLQFGGWIWLLTVIQLCNMWHVARCLCAADKLRVLSECTGREVLSRQSSLRTSDSLHVNKTHVKRDPKRPLTGHVGSPQQPILLSLLSCYWLSDKVSHTRTTPQHVLSFKYQPTHLREVSERE